MQFQETKTEKEEIKMFDYLLTFFLKYKVVIIFYSLIILFVIFNKKKFQFQAKIIALYRTKIGVKLIHFVGKKFPKTIQYLGYLGIIVGHVGIIFATGLIFYGLYQLIFDPSAPATIAPVIPGVQIPGSSIFVPFWYGIISLFVVVLVHEFSHGIVAAAHKIKVDNTGIVFFGPLIGAFVEPNEKQMDKKKWLVQESIFAAGPFSNMILTLVAFGLIIFAISPLLNIVAEDIQIDGFYFNELVNDFPAQKAGLEANTIYNSVNNQTVTNSTGLLTILNKTKPGDNITINNITITTIASPENPNSAYLGVLGVSNNFIYNSWNQKVTINSLIVLSTFLFWVAALSLGIGIANLLPLGPVDGGRMVLLSLEKKFSKKKALMIFSKFSFILFLIIMLLLFVPILKALF
jgi:membrane-associated protease RseP (regulator of RpoE activity)